MSLTGRDLLTLADLTPEELRGVLDAGHAHKAGERSGMDPDVIERSRETRVAALVFLKPSVRTRVSFEVACHELRVHPVVLGPGDAFSRAETVADTTRVLERYVDLIVLRTFAHAHVVEVGEAASVPVINALTDSFHPCQGLADLITIEEHVGDLRDVTLAYVGDGNNIANTLLLAGALTGMRVRIATPSGYEVSDEVADMAREVRERHGLGGPEGEFTHDPREAVEGADVVYTDTWASMGQEDERADRLAAFAGYSVDAPMMSLAAESSVFMHCLPAHRGEEVQDEVMDHHRSVVFDQAENRLHAQRALMSSILG